MMDWPWLLGIAGAVVYFTYFEWRAFVHPSNQDTLSRFIANMGARWPPSIFFFGFFVGFLASHFFWAWPQNPLAGGG